MATVTKPRPPRTSPVALNDELEALIEEARRRARRRRLQLAAAVLCAVVIGAGAFATIAFTRVMGRTTSGGFNAAELLAGGRLAGFRPYSFGYVRETFLGVPTSGDRILIARTKKQGRLWDRWLTHRRTTPPGAAYFPRETLLGVFLLGHPTSRAQGVVVTGLAVKGETLMLSLKVSPLPVARCGPDPMGGSVCRPMYKAPSTRYHAMTIVSVPRKTAAKIHRVVLTREDYDPNEIEVSYPG